MSMFFVPQATEAVFVTVSAGLLKLQMQPMQGRTFNHIVDDSTLFQTQADNLNTKFWTHNDQSYQWIFECFIK